MDTLSADQKVAVEQVAALKANIADLEKSGKDPDRLLVLRSHLEDTEKRLVRLKATPRPVAASKSSVATRKSLASMSDAERGVTHGAVKAYKTKAAPWEPAPKAKPAAKPIPKDKADWHR